MPEWDYGRALPPELWHLMEGSQAHGMRQSPVDIQTASLRENPNLAPIVAKYKPIPLEAFFFRDLHLELETVGNAGGLEIAKTIFPLKQIHVHAPAEHIVDGIAAKLEIHLIHSDGRRNHIVGVFVKIGVLNPAVQKLVDRLPHVLYEPGERERWAKSVPRMNPIDLFPANRSYFRYAGSLTTPPCTENTTFYLFATPIVASVGQIRSFERYAPGGNNRPVQPLNGRVIEYLEIWEG